MNTLGWILIALGALSFVGAYVNIRDCGPGGDSKDARATAIFIGAGIALGWAGLAIVR